ncbi:MAG: prolipoprotein diacylglyceryl transferase [Anaerolineae bacterium]|nr:prolipoprotein diacylglyceryl transferase [Anaerolineae bacterium]
MSFDREGISIVFWILDFKIHYYGVILMLGVVAAAYLAEFEARRRKKKTDFLWDSLIWVVLGGVVGARLWHVFTPSQSAGLSTQYYLSHPLAMFEIWNGGLGIPGAVAGGALTLYWISQRKRQKFLEWADIIIPGVALGQAIGRWGNFINQELYGKPTDLPWKIFISPENRIPANSPVEYYHPLFLYESLLNLANMFLLLWLGRRYKDTLKSGDLLLVYLIVYPLARFWLEFLRLDISQVGGLNINQALMGLTAVVSAGLLVYRHKYAKPGRRRTRRSRRGTRRRR